MKRSPAPIRGRGAASNPENRFERVAVDLEEPAEGPKMQFFRDTTRVVVSRNDSPDIGFSASINPYRGCEHGCIYCYARPTHEYLGFSAGLDFESRIMIKENAPRLLRDVLAGPDWVPQVIAISGVTDAYQPVERRLGITRRCLEVLAEFRNPVSVVTKNFLVTRDADILAKLAQHRAAAVALSITTLRPELARVMEPRASSPKKRLEAISALRDAGVAVGVGVAPVIPGLTDEEIPAILHAAAQAGASFAHTQIVRLPHGVKNLFTDWLVAHFPNSADKVLNRIREMRGDRLNDSRFGARMLGEGVFAEQIHALFRTACRKYGLSSSFPQLSVDAFTRAQTQLSLFP